MKKLGVIHAIKGLWGMLVVIMPRKDRKRRIYIDYQKLNIVTEKDIYPLPNINKILDSFGKAK
ncbi:16334_t:CDS:1, partial [Dentiscutata heterogama]